VVDEAVPEDARGTVVFLHGRYGCNAAWEPLIFDLSRHFRCLAIELPGFGGSFFLDDDREATLAELGELVSEVLERLGVDLERTVWVGHDTGGALAQLLTAKAARLPAGIVLVNSACLSLPLTGGEHDLVSALSGWAHRRRLRSLLRQSGRLPDEVRRSLEHVWHQMGARGDVLRSVQGIAHGWPQGDLELRRWGDALRTFTRPVLVLWGRRDELNPPEIAALLMRTYPDAELFEHEDCGHWPGLEQTGWVLSKLRPFLFRALSIRSARRSLSR